MSMPLSRRTPPLSVWRSRTLFVAKLSGVCALLAVANPALPEARGQAPNTDAADILKGLLAQPTSRALLDQLRTVIGRTPDASEKNKLSTIYALGSVLAGQPDQWRRVSAYIEREARRSDWAEIVASKSFSDLCSGCDGVGYSYRDCNTCRGDGRCRPCEGEGKRQVGLSGAAGDCLTCQGTGRCRNCEDSGKLKTQCMRCRGSGLTAAPELLREIYMDLLRGRPSSAILSAIRARLELQKMRVEHNTNEREREREYAVVYNTLRNEQVSASIRVMRVFDEAILATGYSRTHTLPSQFWVTDIAAGLVDGDRWDGVLYNIGRLTLTAPGGIPYTFRVFSASHENAAKTIVDAQRAEAAPVADSREAAPVAARSTGTGWLCRGGYIVTCYHVIHGSDNITLVSPYIGRVSARLVRHDSANDIAILRPLQRLDIDALPIARVNPSMGDNVYTVGFPHTDIMGEAPKLGSGIISAVTGFRDDPRTLQISVPVQSGNSGGPLFNERGEVVGIIASKLAAAKVFRWTGDLPQNVNYAIKTGYLELLLDSLPMDTTVPVRLPEHMSLNELAREVVYSTVLVICE